MKSTEEEVSTRWYRVSGRVAQKCAPAVQSPQSLAQKCAPPFPAGPKMRPDVRPGRQIFNKTPLPTQKPTTPLCHPGLRSGVQHKTATAEGGFLISFLSATLKSWQNSEKTGAKAAIFGQKPDKTEQRADKKGKGTDKLGVRKNTYKTAFPAQKPGKTPTSPFFCESGKNSGTIQTINHGPIRRCQRP